MNQTDKNFFPCDTDILPGEAFVEYFLSTDQVRQIMKYTIRYLMISAEQSGRHTAAWGDWDFQSGCLIPSGRSQKALPRGWPLSKNTGDWKC